MMRATVPLLVVFVAAAGCKDRDGRGPSTQTGSNVQTRAVHDAAVDGRVAEPDTSYRWYRVEGAVDAVGRVPFIVGVHRDRPEGLIWSGEERLPVVVLTRDPLHLRIPIRGIELRFGSADTGKQLRGTWLAAFYYKKDFPIVASPIDAPSAEILFPSQDAPSFDINGSWRFEIHDFGVGRATFRQDAKGVVVGTIIPPEVGDLRHLTGRASGNRIQLQAFDGIHGFYIDLTSRDGGNTLEGTWLIAGIGTMKLRGTRADPPSTHLRVSARMAPGKTRLTLPQLDEPPYKGNPVVVDYFGSWCPVCIDLTPELVRIQREHATSGLQVLSIALEPPGDETETRRRLDEFRAEFGMTWPFHIVFTDDFNGAVAPEVVDATGFPVTIFLRRDHTVAAVHTGFISRAAGPEHDAAVKLIEGYVQEIVGGASSQR